MPLLIDEVTENIVERIKNDIEDSDWASDHKAANRELFYKYDDFIYDAIELELINAKNQLEQEAKDAVAKELKEEETELPNPVEEVKGG